MPDVLARADLDNAVRDLREREGIVLGYSRIRRHQATAVTARRICSMIAATGLTAGIALVAAAPATSALASTATPLTITTTSPLTATAGSAYLAKLDASGGTKPYSWSLAGGTSLPAGLVLHASNGEITGTPVGPAGTFNFTAEVTDQEDPAASATAPESITVTVSPLTITTETLPVATAGVPYSATLAAVGGVAPYSWLDFDPLPAGLKLHAATGVISGTPTASGLFVVNVEVADSEAPAQLNFAAYGLYVSVSALVVTTGSTLPTATSGVPYSVKLGAAGGLTPYQWSLSSGSLPAGLKLKSSGVISGTTTATGPDSFTVQVTDAEAPPASATETVSLDVVTPMVVPYELPGAVVGESYDSSLQPAGGLGPYSYAITAGSLPPGLALQPDGEITGQASATGTSPFTVSVTDSENPPATVAQAESITVTAEPTTCSVAATPATSGIGTGVTYQFTLNGGDNPTGTVTFSLTNSQDATVDNESAPDILGDGTYTPSPSESYTPPAGYTPTDAGDYVLLATYSGDDNNSGCQATADVSITAATPAITASETSTPTIVTPFEVIYPVTVDTATISGAYNPSPSGTITFNLYGPFTGPAPTCTSPISTQVVNVTSGNASYQTPQSYSLSQTGTYYWTASYSGDINNAATATSCGDPLEQITVP